ncbi:MAG: rRNA pseudouridine synthase [candidate division Zixibacteria bacterium]|nr:rRNA pseudouridine synthase [candidate division Zixibacteria bacterium]
MGQKTRINKYMALCGVASRRKAEELISEGRVTINGATLTELGTLVDHDKDKVTLDGQLIEPARILRYFLFYKPKEVLTSLGDPFGRKTISDYVDDIPERVFPVGRLDYDTTGVLLLTNDGDLAHKLTHPSYQVRKIY